MSVLLGVVHFYQEKFWQHPWLLPAAAGILGLFIGSFLNVVALRVPIKDSIVFPPSHCVHCKHRLHAMDLIPVFSYLSLLGRCRYCRIKISPIYLAGEIITAVLFVITAWMLGPVPELMVGFFFSAILTTVTVTDLKYMLIPDKIIFFAVIVGLILRLFIHPLPLWNHLLGMVIGGGTLYCIAWLSLVVLRKEGMGGGDIKLFLFIGLIMGWQLTLLALFAASLFGSLYGAVLLVLQRMDSNRILPFAPFICMGAMVCYLWGNYLIHWYIGLVRSLFL